MRAVDPWVAIASPHAPLPGQRGVDVEMNTHVSRFWQREQALHNQDINWVGGVVRWSGTSGDFDEGYEILEGLPIDGGSLVIHVGLEILVVKVVKVDGSRWPAGGGEDLSEASGQR